MRREAVRALLDRLVTSGEEAGAGADGVPEENADWLRDTIARLANVEPEAVHPGAHLIEDLALDSLALVELGEELEARTGRTVGTRDLATAATIADLLRAVSASGSGPTRERSARPRYEVERYTPQLPGGVQRLGKALIGRVQNLTYGRALTTRVFGRGHIPYNRNVLVVANHAISMSAWYGTRSARTARTW